MAATYTTSLKATALFERGDIMNTNSVACSGWLFAHEIMVDNHGGG
jgi:hypothetical protein